MGVRWTEEQRQVITLRDRNILVSAAAGSGKTAVLVERIITMLTDSERPVDVDRLLVVTFTEAAAAEMKERIRRAIEERAEQEPENERLRRQATLIHGAQITTIHSFCLSVIREHFHTIDLDPGFRIGEEGELKLLRQDVLAELLEECYQKADPDFLRFTESYGGTRDDRRIESLILRLYEFSRSYPDPEEWLADCVRAYDAETMEELEETPVYRRMRASAEKYLEGAGRLLEKGIGICLAPEGPSVYEPMLEDDVRQVKELARALAGGDYAACRLAFRSVKWTRLAPNKDPLVSPELTQAVKKIRETVKGIVKELDQAYFAQPGEEVLADLALCRPMIRTLTGLTLEFGRAFEEKKRGRNLIDFDDMQQYAMRILTEKRDGKRVPSRVAREYQEIFQEVMIDEYQDSNLIQETILTSVSGVSRGRNNLFMVGDVKQSIYRFRLSRPELFMEKYRSYTLEESSSQRIDLHKNFRSRLEVLEGANAIFRRLMTRELGGVEYDDRAALYPGAEYPEPEEPPDGGNAPELLLIAADRQGNSSPWEEEPSAREKEALAIADRIRRLLAEQQVLDKETGKLRPVRYRDMVILTRSLKGYADVYGEVLKNAGIPVCAGAREGYFETREIGLLLDYLRVLNNRKQDLPLTAVLHSVFGGLSDGELAEIRSVFRTEPFYEAVRRYAEEGPAGEIQRKLRRCLDQMERFRSMIPCLALHRLLEKILQETGYGDYVAALPAGEQREANLRMLLEKAKAFESTSYKGVFHFIRYVEQLKKYEIEQEEAGTLDGQTDAVRLMSIHKSKGLEFPVVIVAGLGKRFNRQDTSGDVLLHAKLGVGLEAIDLERRTRASSFVRSVIAREELLENLGEELRVLYVALTRAKEKLIMTGTTADPEKKLLEAEILGSAGEWGNDPSGKLSFAQLAGASGYLDWLIPAVAGKESPVRVETVDPEALYLGQVQERASQLLTRQLLEEVDPGTVYDERMRDSLEEQFSYRYPYRSLEGRKLKYTVSELKKRAWLKEEAGETPFEEETVIPLIPRFLQKEQEPAGAQRGSAYHRVMELLDFAGEYDLAGVREAIAAMKAAGRIDAGWADAVDPEDILAFLHTISGRRMQTAARQGRLKKEQPFVLGIPAEEAGLSSDGELILIQGIIDVFFGEEDGLVVLDYKTDKVRSGDALLEKYRAQLEYYARALEQITGERVKEKIIYSFTLGEEICL